MGFSAGLENQGQEADQSAHLMDMFSYTTLPFHVLIFKLV